MLTTHLTRKLDIPHEEGEWIEFKMPSWVEIDQAKAERRRKVWADMRETREVIGKEIIDDMAREQREEADRKAALAEEGEETTAIATIKTPEEILNEYDKAALLNAGIKTWSYCEPYTAEDAPYPEMIGRPNPAKPTKVSVQTIAALDPITATWAGLTLAALVQSGFDPPLPDVHVNGRIVEIQPRESDPFLSASPSTGF